MSIAATGCPLPDNETELAEAEATARVIATTHAVMMCGNHRLGPLGSFAPLPDIHAAALRVLGFDTTGRSADYLHGAFDAMFAAGVRLPRHDLIP